MEAAAVAETIDQEDLAEVNLDGPPLSGSWCPTTTSDAPFPPPPACCP
jgi:hypothetical protein